MKNTHLTQEQVKEVLGLYYSTQCKRSEIVELYDLNVPSEGAIWRYLPDPNIESDCEVCGCEIKSKWVTPRRRKNYVPEINQQKAYCPSCLHQPFDKDSCKCTKCTEEKQQKKESEEREKREWINKTREELPTVSIAKIQELIILGSLRQQSTSEDLNIISPVSQSIDYFYPLATNKKYLELVQSVSEFLLPISPECMSIKDGEVSWSGLHAYHEINASKACKDDIDPFKHESLNMDARIRSNEFNKFLEDLMIDESINYLNIVKSRYRFDMDYGEKTTTILKELLQEFTISQLFSLIWTGCKNAAAFYQRSPMNRQNASKSCITFVKKYADLCKQKGWDVRSYGRENHNPESTISNFIMKRVLGMDDDIITFKPSDLFVEPLDITSDEGHKVWDEVCKKCTI